MAVVTESFYIPSKVDGLQLSVMTITPDCAPIGIVQISHGMCEHKEKIYSYHGIPSFQRICLYYS